MAIKIPHAFIKVPINKALALRELISDGVNDAEKLDFLCPNCQTPIRPHKLGGKIPAHFEHVDGKVVCEFTYYDNSPVTE